MTYNGIIDSIRKEQGGIETSWDITESYDENGKISQITCTYRWVKGDQIYDVEIKGMSFNSNDWKKTKKTSTNTFMELYRHTRFNEKGFEE